MLDELGLLNVTQDAAKACIPWIGKGDPKAADGAAVQAMRAKLNSLSFKGTVVIGEGEKDEAPMLYIGEPVGKGGKEYDIAVDPLECTSNCAKGTGGSMTVIACAPKGTLLGTTTHYMEKLFVGPQVGTAVSLEKSFEENLHIIKEKTQKDWKDLKIVCMDRPRNQHLFDAAQKLGISLVKIPRGDLAPSIQTCLKGFDVDAVMGIGGAPEGVIAAVALRALGGYGEARLSFKDAAERERAQKNGLSNPDALFRLNDIVNSDDLHLVATGVTSGDLLKGIQTSPYLASHSLVIRKGHYQFVQSDSL